MFLELLFEELFLPFLARHMCRHRIRGCKGKGIYMCCMMYWLLFGCLLSLHYSRLCCLLWAAVFIYALEAADFCR